MWFKIDSFDTNGTFLWTIGGTVKRFYMNSSGNAVFRSGVNTTLTSTTFATGNWYHVVCTYDADTNVANAYVNGTLDGAFPISAGTTYQANTTLRLGYYPLSLGGWDLIGEMAEVIIYTRAISQSEVTALYGNGRIPTSPSVITGSGNLLARYNFSTADGDTLANIYNRIPGGSAFDSAARLNYSLLPAATGLTQTAVTAYESSYPIYDNLFVQHQIPRSEQQYAWITGSMLSGTTIYGLDAASCISASTMSQLVTGAAPSYYGEAYLQNFVGQAGRLVIDSTNTQTHLQYANKYSPLDVGTYAGNFHTSYVTNDGDWNSLIGGSSPGTPFTISMWFYATGVSGSLVEVGDGFDGNDHKSIHFTADQKVAFKTGTAVNPWFGRIESSRLELNKWYHAAITYDGTNPGGSNTANHYKIYINGVNDTTVTQEVNTPNAIGTSPGYMCVGVYDASDFNRPSFEDPTFQGFIADVAIWDDDLSAGEVTTLYNDGNALSLSSGAPHSSDLIAWYRFDPFSGDRGYSVLNRAPVATRAASTDLSGGANPEEGLGAVGLPPEILFTRFSPNSIDGLNILLNNRGGTYGWPTWKQIRAGESKVATKLR